MDICLSKIECLSGTVLKLIAVFSMTIDHIGFIFFPQLIWLRWLGRLAFPIFAYMIAEGCFYTKNKKRYLLLVTAIGILCQAAMVIFRNSWNLNIMFSFAFSILLIFLLQKAVGRKQILGKASDEVPDSAIGNSGIVNDSGSPFYWILFVFVLLVCLFLDFVLSRLCPGFILEYGFFGVTLAVVIYIAPEKYQKLMVCLIWLVFLTLARRTPIQWWSLFSVIPLALYNGKPGRHRMKYFFYLYYPVHLAILWGIFFIQ